MGREGRVPRVDGPLPAGQDVDGDGRWVVPPDFRRDTPEEPERLDQSVQDRLSPLGRQGESERGVRVTPGDDPDRNRSPAAREVDRDVSAVGFGP
ncbi:hypothetical protein [Fimbriiglobus ruber]|uniref:hypothetical protein n=1 Tax=Fimbriiglobus ruber TaxID=1908690 RepID=UPI000B4AC865